jgi:endogenous inhibitor of DNA gyrase (YacG/DUF329 family)
MCPICAKASVERHKPFCSARCAQRDLGRWLNESYTIPAAEPLEDEEEERGDPPHKNSYH